MAAQAEHPPARATLRFEDAHRHARLAQPVAGGEAGDAGADDHDLAGDRRRRRCARARAAQPSSAAPAAAAAGP